jgi:hypothetical protein
MTAQMSFDTLAFVKRLADAGMDKRQAEALAGTPNEIVFDTLAAKSDLRELELRIAGNLRDLELRISGNLKDLELRLTNSLTGRMGAMNAATIAILGALITFS